MKEIILFYAQGYETVEEYPNYTPDMGRTDPELIDWIKARRAENPIVKEKAQLEAELENLMQNPAWKELETADDGYHFSYSGGGYRVGSLKEAEDPEFCEDYPMENWNNPEIQEFDEFTATLKAADIDISVLGLQDFTPVAHVYETPQAAYEAVKPIMLQMETIKSRLAELSKHFEYNGQLSDGFTILTFNDAYCQAKVERERCYDDCSGCLDYRNGSCIHNGKPEKLELRKYVNDAMLREAEDQGHEAVKAYIETLLNLRCHVSSRPRCG